MLEQRSQRTETVGASRVEQLLGLIRALSRRDSSPALRRRLEMLCSERLRAGADSGVSFDRTRSRPLPWLRAAFAALLLIAAGLPVAFVAHLRQHEPLRAEMKTSVNPAAAPFSGGIGVPAATPRLEPKPAKARRASRQPAHIVSSRQMVVRLPYSNSAVATGTDATIRISMSQSELLSLGFPMNAPLHDRQVVAELTLGADGLPRAISVPLPLEVLKDKK
jgi:hypothetical protein